MNTYKRQNQVLTVLLFVTLFLLAFTVSSYHATLVKIGYLSAANAVCHPYESR